MKRVKAKDAEKPQNSASPVERLVIPEYGSFVTVTERYKRAARRVEVNKPYQGYENWKKWERMPYSAKCLFLGVRTLKNGTRSFDSEYGWEFSAREHFQAALVCPGEKENPVYVPMDAIEV